MQFNRLAVAVVSLAVSAGAARADVAEFAPRGQAQEVSGARIQGGSRGELSAVQVTRGTAVLDIVASGQTAATSAAAVQICAGQGAGWGLPNMDGTVGDWFFPAVLFGTRVQTSAGPGTVFWARGASVPEDVLGIRIVSAAGIQVVGVPADPNHPVAVSCTKGTVPDPEAAPGGAGGGAITASYQGAVGRVQL